MEVGYQRHVTTALPPEIPWHPQFRRLGGPQGRSGGLRKILLAPGLDLRTVQPVASRYTDCAIPVHPIMGYSGFFTLRLRKQFRETTNTKFYLLIPQTKFFIIFSGHSKKSVCHFLHPSHTKALYR